MHPVLKPIHIMVDNETLSVLPSAHIVQVALVHFDPHSFTPLADKVISIDHARQSGTSVDVSTVHWWMEQPKDVQKAVFYGEEERVPIHTACCDLYRFIIDSCRRIWMEDAPPSLSDLHQAVQIWAKPARFDIPQWENAFRHAGVQVPWFRRNVNNVQSLFNDALRNGFDPGIVKAMPSVAHIPINDCLWQIGLLKSITEFNRK